MNFREGTRRLALLLGVVGALLGGYGSLIAVEGIQYQKLAPSVGSYVLIATFPLLGFFVAWGVVRAIAWMIAGFSHPPQ